MLELLAKHNSDFNKKNNKMETIFDILKQKNSDDLLQFTKELLIT